MPERIPDILARCRDENVHFLRLQFTDIDGIIKNVEVPESQFEKALSGEIMFDGSSIEGFTRIEESDMLLSPDLSTFAVFPWESQYGRIGRLICDISSPDGTPFPGCPRSILKRQTEKAARLGYRVMVGPEAEFFLFHCDGKGNPVTETHDRGGYFDLSPVDRGEDARRDVVLALEAMGYEVEAAHHEVAPGQHEIDFRYVEAVEAADNIVTFKFVVKKVALLHGLHATFMPKPMADEAGSGMHTHFSMFDSSGSNVFYGREDEFGLSPLCREFIAGVLEHAMGFTAVTNPLVNSYKRLVPGYEAPINVAWSMKNRSPLIRIPEARGKGTRCEIRVPDPSCNPYLALAVMLAAGLDGIENGLECGEPVNRNIFSMSGREKKRLKIRTLPDSLAAALDHMEKDETVREAMGEHVFQHFLLNKRREWDRYIKVIHPWELERYLDRY
ncbi:MAG TPA: type I glutamate--ammonia ligase [Candidatus Sabulitectum sp.]|nr:type I glutamate--ammonia ligase [Candidatus Sabulitectum sp.]HPJ27905.1 type I glutamate--ammonia ligase [Candidatus Sabulitectum sp.]HPR21866.1 type I glutamate--ammonia ligase [Candidatus Sabulitectum sp.]